MTDEAIINLYWRRADTAITETDKAYGKFCLKVANNVLSNPQDSEESVNDAYLATWNTIPPTRPNSLKAYLGKLTRRIAVSRLRHNTAKRRAVTEADFAIEELAECVPGRQNVENEVIAAELAEIINAFLLTVSERDRKMFVARYWYVMPIADIAERFELRQGAVKTSLYRTREKLRLYLEENA